MTKDETYLQHIAERLERIERYTQDGEEAFLLSALVQDAVIRNFEVIGEAVKRLSSDCRNHQGQVEWRKFVGFQCTGVDLKELWRTVKSDVPKLKAEVLAAVSDLKK